MDYRVNFQTYSGVFAVPNKLVDEQIKMCSALQLKVLLILLRSGGEAVSDEYIAAKLGLSVRDIEDALTYWVQAGFLLGESQQALGEPTPSKTDATVPTADEKPEPMPKAQRQKEKVLEEGEHKVVLLSNKPRLTRQEALNLASKDKKLNQLLQEVQVVLGKPLTSAEMDTVVSLYSYYGLTGDFILLAVHYCKTLEKCNMRYVEKTISSWVDEGVDTYEKAERHIMSLSRKQDHESLVRSAFGIGERSLIKKERDFIHNWFDVYGFDIAMVKLAYERTVASIGKLSFPYINKILTTWHEKGFKTAQEAAQEQAPQPKGSGKASYDIGELERRILDDFVSTK